MGSTADPISALREHFASTTVKLYAPDAPDYQDIESTFIVRQVKTLGVARPQNAEDVSALVRFCTRNNVEFSVRSGGHDCAGRSKIEDGLLIDMRDIKHVVVAADKATARVGGGILLGDLAKGLETKGLLTPTGTIASVGYVGWSTLGGYGPFSACHGLGVDQIIGAKVVNAKGEVVDADDEMLMAIRGAGGTLGIIVELTIKVYPSGNLLSSTIIYESSNLATAMTSFNDFYEKAMESKELPDVLQLQPAVMEIPGIGISFGIIGFWAGTDEEEGRQWMKKVAGAGKCIMEMTQPITLTEFVEANEKLVTWPSYGRTFTVSFKRFTPKTIEVLSKHGLTPPGGGLSFSVHTLRHPRPSEESVFGSRDAHHMLEIIALGGDASMQEERAVWASKLKEELQTEDPDNMVDSTYVSLGTDRDTDLKKVYGHHHSTLLELKKKYDAENVFKYAVPRLLPIDEKQIAG